MSTTVRGDASLGTTPRSTFSFSSSPSRLVVEMPLSYDHVASHNINKSAEQAVPIPQRPLSSEDGIKMYEAAIAVAHAFLGNG